MAFGFRKRRIKVRLFLLQFWKILLYFSQMDYAGGRDEAIFIGTACGDAGVGTTGFCVGGE
jgi:hypothetical protein